MLKNISKKINCDNIFAALKCNLYIKYRTVGGEAKGRGSCHSYGRKGGFGQAL